MIQRVIHQPAAKESVPVGVSHRIGMLMVGRTHMPLADTTGYVSLLLHEVRDRLCAFRKPLLRIQWLCGIPVVAERGLNPASNKSGSRRTAHTARYISLREACSVFGKLVDVWRWNIFASLETDVCVAKIVCHDDHDVRTVGGKERG